MRLPSPITDMHRFVPITTQTALTSRRRPWENRADPDGIRTVRRSPWARLARTFVIAAIALGIAAPAAFGASQHQLAKDLNGTWAFVIQTPVPQNPFTSTNNRCVHLGTPSFSGADAGVRPARRVVDPHP